jgi:hypothetical protein
LLGRSGILSGLIREEWNFVFSLPPETPPTATTTDPGSANSNGLRWALGIAPNVVLGQDSQWTKDMQNSIIVGIDRARIKKKLSGYCKTYGGAASDLGMMPESAGLGGELGGQPDSIPWQIYPIYFFWKQHSNPTEAFIGGWTRGEITVLTFDCCLSKATIHFHAVNVSGWQSASHLPPMFYQYGDSIIGDNDLGDLGRNVSQTFDWNEDISF